MTTQITRLESVSPNELEKNSPKLEIFEVSGSDGSIRIFSRARVPQASATACIIYSLEAAHTVEPDKSSFSAFDELVESLESDRESAAQLSEGRKWVSETFYTEAPTLASLRLAAGLSQRQLGQACGIEQPHVSRYESGKHEPSISAAAAMACALGVNLDLFFQAWNNSRNLSHSEASQ